MSTDKDPVTRWPVKIGGLFRCCIEHAERTRPDDANTTECPHCHTTLQWSANAWRWVNPEC